MTPLFFGLAMALVDAIVLSALKMRHIGILQTNLVFGIAFVVYGLQPLVFYKALNYATMMRMNMLWDLLSDIIITVIGFYVFREFATRQQMMGILLGIISIWLLH